MQRYRRRHYRDWINAQDLYATDFVAREADLQIFTNKKLKPALIEERVRALRWDLEQYVNKDRLFLASGRPVTVATDAPEIVREMARASALAGIGPINTIAGAVAQFLGSALLKIGFKDVIVENGKNIFLATARSRKISFYSGRSKLWDRLKLKILPRETPLGICLSSGARVRSSGLRGADCIAVIAKNTTLAAAIAAALAARIQTRKDLQPAVDSARAIKGVLGIIIILKGELVSWGGARFVK